MKSLIFEVSHIIKITLFSFSLSYISIVVGHLGFMLKFNFCFKKTKHRKIWAFVVNLITFRKMKLNCFKLEG